MPLTETLYEASLVAARPVLAGATLVSGRTRGAVRGRAASLERFREWSSTERAGGRPLVWIHAPSVGEALMARAIIAALRDERPDVQIAFTHFSPSAERVVADVGADVGGYVPFDTRGPVREALTALRPTAIAFVRTEVWPVLTREAERAGASLVLVNAVLADRSGRLRWPGRAVLEVAYGRLSAVGAVSDGHGERYERLGVPSDRIRVTGDARFDQVWDRVESRGLAAVRGQPDAIDRVPADLRPLWRLLDDPATFTLVAGSTWAADEKVLLPPLNVIGRTRKLRLVIAPHEPTSPHLESLERRLDRQSLRHARLSALVAAAGPAPEVVVVDRLGVLADLYALADAAYVGGGFGTDGLHSVVEPAALGVPVLFGPEHANAPEADGLVEAGGGFEVDDAGGFEDRVRQLLGVEGSGGVAGDETGARADASAAVSAGASAREYVRGQTGAAARNAALILERL